MLRTVEHKPKLNDLIACYLRQESVDGVPGGANLPFMVLMDKACGNRDLAVKAVMDYITDHYKQMRSLVVNTLNEKKLNKSYSEVFGLQFDKFPSDKARRALKVAKKLGEDFLGKYDALQGVIDTPEAASALFSIYKAAESLEADTKEAQKQEALSYGQRHLPREKYMNGKGDMLVRPVVIEGVVSALDWIIEQKDKAMALRGASTGLEAALLMKDRDKEPESAPEEEGKEKQDYAWSFYTQGIMHMNQIITCLSNLSDDKEYNANSKVVFALSMNLADIEFSYCKTEDIVHGDSPYSYPKMQKLSCEEINDWNQSVYRLGDRVIASMDEEATQLLGSLNAITRYAMVTPDPLGTAFVTLYALQKQEARDGVEGYLNLGIMDLEKRRIDLAKEKA